MGTLRDAAGRVFLREIGDDVVAAEIRTATREQDEGLQVIRRQDRRTYLDVLAGIEAIVEFIVRNGGLRLSPAKPIDSPI